MVLSDDKEKASKAGPINHKLLKGISYTCICNSMINNQRNTLIDLSNEQLDRSMFAFPSNTNNKTNQNCHWIINDSTHQSLYWNIQ